MQFTNVVLALAAAASTLAYSNDTVVWVTETAVDYVTYCPASATITLGGHTITNTKSVGVTITVPCPGGCVKSYPVTTYAPPAPTKGYNATAPVPTPNVPAKTTPVSPPVFTGAAGKMSVAGAAGVAALAAYFL